MRVNKANLQALRFDALDDRLQLTGQATDLLEVTPEESDRLKSVLDELKKRVDAHDLKHLEIVTEEEVHDSDVAQFLQDREGEKTISRISPNSEQDKSAVQDWFYGSVSEIVGEERKDLFEKNARTALDFGLGGTEDQVIAFIDRVDPEGRPIEHECMIKFNTPSRSGTFSGSGNQAVPGMLEYMFETAKNYTP